MNGTMQMDTSAAQTVKTEILDTVEAMRNRWMLFNRRVDEFTSTDWKSRSSSQFFDIFRELVELENIRLDELNQLASKLDMEIAAWENTNISGSAL